MGLAIVPVGIGGLVGGVLTWRDQVRTGLVNLGWQARDADQAIATIEPDLVPPDGGGEVDVAVALRSALKVLGRTSGRA